MRRRILGVTALVLLGLWAVIELFHPLDTLKIVAEFGLRTGTILGVMWLAWPDLRRLPRWTWFAGPIALLVLIARPQYLLLLIPLLLVLAIVKPRFGQKT